MNRPFSLLLALPMTVMALSQASAAGWSEVKTPTKEAPRSIGRPNLGCLAGGVALPLDGVGYHVLRPQRNRFYGQPVLLKTITAVAEQMAKQGHGSILIGDMSQPRGGRMNFGHASHQTGLDVDLWLKMQTGPLSASDRAEPQAVSMVPVGARQADPTLWGPAQSDLVRIAAQQSAVVRIFANPAIKATLCQTFAPHGEASAPAWLRKVRPWKGHDEHIHLRLSCPPGNRDCVDQDPPPSGSGCGAELQAWFEPPVTPTLRIPVEPPPPAPTLPKACQAVLSQK